MGSQELFLLVLVLYALASMLDSRNRRYPMGYPTKVQLISRKKTANQYYINFPTAIAEAMGFSKGETVYWEIHDRRTMVLERPDAPPSPLEKKTAR